MLIFWGFLKKSTAFALCHFDRWCKNPCDGSLSLQLRRTGWILSSPFVKTLIFLSSTFKKLYLLVNLEKQPPASLDHFRYTRFWLGQLLLQLFLSTTCEGSPGWKFRRGFVGWHLARQKIPQCWTAHYTLRSVTKITVCAHSEPLENLDQDSLTPLEAGIPTITPPKPAATTSKYRTWMLPMLAACGHILFGLIKKGKTTGGSSVLLLCIPKDVTYLHEGFSRQTSDPFLR